MTVRDSHVMHIVDILGEVPLSALAQGLVDAIAEAEVDGIFDVARDPAIMAFGAFISFHTHCDIATPSDYRKAVEQCTERYSTPRTMQ